jgi:hypothetical protein
MAISKKNKQWLIAIVLVTIITVLIDYFVNHSH